MDEFEEYRSRAYSSGEYNMHRPVCVSSSCPCPSSSSSSSSEGPPKHAQHCAELDRLTELRISEGDGGDSVFGPPEDNVASRFLSHHGGARNSNPFTRSGTGSPKSFHAHHNRSHSCRTRPARRPRELELVPVTPMRRRTYSMPTKNRYRSRRQCQSEDPESAPHSRNSSLGDDDDEYVRVRTFSTSAKGIINRGDSFKKRSQQNLELACQAPAGAVVPPASDLALEPRNRSWSNTSAGSSVASSSCSVPSSPRLHKVVVMGAQGVGKTSIIHQFMTSEYMGNADNSIGEYTGNSEFSVGEYSHGNKLRQL